jgi:5'-nucleotidase
MNYPLRVTRFLKGKTFFGYAVSGTPADCVKLAVRTILQDTPDLLVSGVNHGSNTSVNIIYSGTVSAATEGTILGIPSIAVSLTTYTQPDFRFAAKFARKLARTVLRHGLPEGTLLNVNVPSVPEREIRGVRVTRQGKTRWDDTFDVRLDPNNKEYYWLTGKLEVTDTAKDTDQVAIMSNYVSVTPIQYDLTDYNSLPLLERWKLNALL